MSHFLIVNAAECAPLRARSGDAGNAVPGLKYEAVAFYAVVPDTQGRCPDRFPIEIKRYFVQLDQSFHDYFVIDPKLREPRDYRPRGPAEDVAFCTDVATAT